ncbi:hypothetical protein OEZ85_008612 [Tetradesmus obliquus]|uniref:HECT-type E3 ubiquitin transferase n=1 Tax=Tetradesmus obliquus TaxID=3088 RepID=A0ABY8TJB5_TETOB|nr:hypothetical protein OEZ85_008612 [Tetradesmus obliquus]
MLEMSGLICYPYLGSGSLVACIRVDQTQLTGSMGQGSSSTRSRPFDDEGYIVPAGAAESRQSESSRTTSSQPGTPAAVASAESGQSQSSSSTATPSSGGQQTPAMAQAAAQQPAAAAPAAPRTVPVHKSTAIIPGWSRPLSSQQLTIECQKITQPSRTASAKECYGVMELEVMKFVAYCGGLTIKLRVDDLQHGQVDSVTWGLAAMRPCHALANSSAAGSGGSSSPDRRAGTPTGSRSGSSAGSNAMNKAHPTTPVTVQNPSQKPLYAICTTATVARVTKGDVLSMDLSPKEDGQPVIMVTLSHNDSVLLRAALPCASIAALQMYPFVTVLSGMVVSLHEALTPSPLFTWYSPTSATADIQMADLDTCVKYNTAANTISSGVSEFHGSTTFTGGRHRWTVQLDNMGQLPGQIFVAVPPKLGDVQFVESVNNHCCITVDLDLIGGYAKFFRNGHLLGQAFTGLTAPISPALAFLQGTNQHLQAGLVNITKLQQLDLEWNPEACSGDLRVTGRVVQKVSEVFGDYSTVLCNQGFISGVHLWLIKVNNLSEPDSIFIGVCRGCMPLDQDPQDLRDRTYYLSNGVIRVGGRRVATNAAAFTKGDIVGVVLDADQGEIVFLRNGIEQGRARGIRGRLYPFVSFDSEQDQITLLGSYTLPLNRTPRTLADMEWDTVGRSGDIELSSNCLTATKTSSASPSTVRGTILYNDTGVHEFHVILDSLGPDGIWVGVASPDMDPTKCVGDVGCGWALHSDGDRRFNGREEEFTGAFKNGDVLTVGMDLANGILRFSRNGIHMGDAFTGVKGPLVAVVTQASEESKVTIQNRPTVLNMGEYTGELRWDEVRAGRDLHVIDGLTVTKMSNEGGDYATVLGTLCVASGQHTWNVYINHVEDSNLFIGVTVGGHDLNADPQEMKSRTYYLSNGTIRVAGKLVTRCAEPYAEGDLVTVQLDMEQHHISFYKNGMLQGAGDGLPEEVWPYVSLDNIMDSITLHSSNMFLDLAHSLKWNGQKCCQWIQISEDGTTASLKPHAQFDSFLGQATVLGLREYSRTEVHSWVVRLEQPPNTNIANFLVGVAPASMDLNHSIGQEGCGIGLDYYGYIYINGKYFHVSNLANWQQVAKPCRGSTARHKGKAGPMFRFHEGKCEITLTLDLKEGTLRFSSGGHSIGTLANVKGPMHAALTLTSTKQAAQIAAGPIGKTEHTAEELVNILKAKGHLGNQRAEAAMLVVPRDLFVPRDRHREAFRDQKVTVRMPDGSTLIMPNPSFVAMALEKLDLQPGSSFLDVGCGSAYVTAVAACMIGPTGTVHGIECLSSRLENGRNNLRLLKERLPPEHVVKNLAVAGSVQAAINNVHLSLTNVLIPECTDGMLYDALYCDNSLSEEDLPAFLSLLKPNGRMVVVIEEDVLLIARSSTDAHDYKRESLTKITGDFGELEDPTPWEVQEAVQRIKQRELEKGLAKAKGEVGNLRSNELLDLQSRMGAAMQRIAELETALQRSNGTAGSRPAGNDDTRAVIRDNKFRRTPRISPHNSARSPGSDPSAFAGSASDNVKMRTRQVLDDSEEPLIRSEKLALEEKLSCGSGKIGTLLQAPSSCADVMQALGVQTLTVAQVASVTAGVQLQQRAGFQLYQGSFRGTRVSAWRLTINQPINTLEVHRAYSRFCAAHPNVCAVMGICLEPLDTAEPMDEDGCGSPTRAAAQQQQQWQHQPLQEVEEAGCHLWVLEEHHGSQTLAARVEQGLISWQHCLSIAQDVGSALAYLQSLKRICPITADAGAEVLDSNALAAPLSPLAVAQMLVLDNVQVSTAATAKISLVPALLTQLEFALCVAPDTQRVAEQLQRKLEALGTSAMSWEQVEELLMMPLQPSTSSSDPTTRRWVRQDFKMRRKLFLEEVAKMAVEGPIHKIEVRRSRCFKDSVATFSGKGQNVWRQPLKVTFIGEAGMDSGGVTREWFSSICAALRRGSLDLFWAGGPIRNQLYINPLSNSASHLKRFHFVGMLMAKALLETAARGKELGPVVLNLSFCEPFWKLLLGIPLGLMDLQALDPTEFRSLMQILQLDIDGLIFENFTWNFQHTQRGNGAKDEPEIPALPSGASPFSGDSSSRVDASIALKPGGNHVKVTNTNKREYVLLKAQKMLWGTVEAQMSAVIDAFHSLVPRELVEKYGFSPLEMQMLVCGEQNIDIADLRQHCKYEDGYTGKEPQIAWFWQAVESMDESQRRALLQFWSGSDGMPAEGFGSLEPAFHLVSVDRMYDRNDRTARLPAAHTCFRQLDLPRYATYEELREKMITAITMGQGYMALS